MSRFGNLKPPSRGGFVWADGISRGKGRSQYRPDREPARIHGWDPPAGVTITPARLSGYEATLGVAAACRIRGHKACRVLGYDQRVNLFTVLACRLVDAKMVEISLPGRIVSAPVLELRLIFGVPHLTRGGAANVSHIDEQLSPGLVVPVGTA